MLDSDEAIVIRIDDPAVRALLPNYLARRNQDVDSIRQWLATDAFDQIAALAHRLRGSGSAYGVDFVTELGRALELAASVGDRAAVDHSTNLLERCLARVKLA